MLHFRGCTRDDYLWVSKVKATKRKIKNRYSMAITLFAPFIVSLCIAKRFYFDSVVWKTWLKKCSILWLYTLDNLFVASHLTNSKKCIVIWAIHWFLLQKLPWKLLNLHKFVNILWNCVGIEPFQLWELPLRPNSLRALEQVRSDGEWVSEWACELTPCAYYKARSSASLMRWSR
jgi:hypothetical protein